MAFVRMLKDLMRHSDIGDRFVPIIPDEARTFGMDSLCPTAKIYSPHGQGYEAVDRNLLLSYKESEKGQILHEGISEAGAMGSMIAAGTAYATHAIHMIPVYIFYSMFGFQRTGDQMWALGDQLGRGVLLGPTAGRTTLSGEGLQHNDGHSVLLASTNPACVSYDAAWAYELSFIVRDALRRMYSPSPDYPDGENIFYYLTVYNEPYVQPAVPADYPGGVEALERGVLRGLYRYAHAPPPRAPTPGAPAAPRGRRCKRRAPGRAAAGADPRLGRGGALGAGRAAAAGRGLGRRRRGVVGHGLDRAAPGRAELRRVEHAAPRRRAARAARGQRAGGPPRAGRRGERLAPCGSRPDRTLGERPGGLARHGRLGHLGPQASRAPVLPRRRRVGHAGRADPAGQGRRAQARGAGPGDQQVPPGPRRQRRAVSLAGRTSWPRRMTARGWPS